MGYIEGGREVAGEEQQVLRIRGERLRKEQEQTVHVVGRQQDLETNIAHVLGPIFWLYI